MPRRGFRTFAEPGRRIVEEELKGPGDALPWIDLAAFSRRAIDLAAVDRALAALTPGLAFFDRGLVDAAVALRHATGQTEEATLNGHARYHHQVFLAPPWPEIYRTDAQRPHSLEEAIVEYERLMPAYERLGYEVVVLPKIDVGGRADFILEALN